MNEAEARKLRVGAVVAWESSGERGKVHEVASEGVRVVWDDGTNAVYLFTQRSHGLLHLIKVAAQ